MLSLVSFFARAKKETRPRCGEPQLAVEIAREARDTIQNLDSRLRGNDNNVAGAEPPAISFSKSKAAFRRLLFIHVLDVRIRGHDKIETRR